MARQLLFAAVVAATVAFALVSVCCAAAIPATNTIHNADAPVDEVSVDFSSSWSSSAETLASFSATTGSSDDAITLNADGQLYDSAGRVVMLRGVNVAHKVPNFSFLDESRSDSYERFIAPLVEWGFNVVRLSFTMEAFLPTSPSRANLEYLAAYRRMVEQLAQRGIHTIVDFHQDVFSRWTLTGCGEGFPEWMVPVEARATPADQNSVSDLYKKGCPLWGLRSALFDAKELKQVYGPLYDAGSTVRRAFLDMARDVAASLKDLPSVIAYDVLNEPQIITNTTSDILPLYREAASAIRSMDPDAIIMYEEIPGAVAQSLENPRIPNSIYSSHFYDLRTGFDLSLSQFEYWLRPKSILPLTPSTFIEDVVFQISVSSKLLPVTRNAVQTSIDSLHDMLRALEPMAKLLVESAADAARQISEHEYIEVEEDNDDDDERVYSSDDDNQTERNADDGAVVIMNEVEGNGDGNGNGIINKSSKLVTIKRFSARAWLEEKIREAEASAIPKFWQHVAELKASLSGLSLRKPWSVGLSASLAALVEALRAVAHELLFRILAPALRRVLPLVGAGAAKTIATAKETAISYGSGYILGEFGVPPGATFLNPRKYIDEVLTAVERALASSIQWGYTPDWNSQTKDGWNLEDFSIIDNKLKPRDNFLVYRPYPERTSGTPLALSVDYAKKSMTYKFKAALMGEPTSIYFPAKGFCGDTANYVVTSVPSGIVDCTSADAISSNRILCRTLTPELVTLSLSCV